MYIEMLWYSDTAFRTVKQLIVRRGWRYSQEESRTGNFWEYFLHILSLTKPH